MVPTSHIECLITSNVIGMTEELKFSFYLTLINLHINVHSLRWLVVTLLDRARVDDKLGGGRKKGMLASLYYRKAVRRHYLQLIE